jgi:Trypsin-co-occurring domain 1
MSDLVRYQSNQGGTVLVEVADPVGGQVVRRGGRPAAVISEAGDTIEQVFGGIGPVVQGVVSQLRANPDWPEQVEVEFAVKISADSSVIIARAGGEANFRVCMRWSKGPAS